MSQKGSVRRGHWLCRWAFGSPVIFSLFVFFGAVLLAEIPLQPLIPSVMEHPASLFMEGIVLQAGLGLALVWLLGRLGLLTLAGFTPPGRWRALWLTWPLVAITLVNVLPLLDGSRVIDTSRPGLVVLYGLYVLSSGFFEEVLVRGLVLTLLCLRWGGTRRGLYLAVLVSSALFGVAHLANVIAGRMSLLPTLTQVTYGIFFGVIFAACALRNRSIWPVILLHAAFNFGGSLVREIVVGGGALPVNNVSFPEVVTTLVLTLPLFLYGLFILRKAEPWCVLYGGKDKRGSVSGFAMT